MAQYAVPIGYSALLWWFSTGIVMYVVGLPRRTFRWSVSAGGVLLLAALDGLATTRSDATAAGGYLAFTFAILAWGAAEIWFLTGFVTGPRPERCPPGCSGAARFSFAVQAIIYHELMLVAVGLAIVATTRAGVNQVGLWTFLVLWAMRLSSKLNLFFGVPFLNDELLPDHLAFVGSYFRQRPMNMLFPISVTLGTAASMIFAIKASHQGTSGHATGCMLLAALLALAVLEHWFMVVPLPVMSLWSWALRSRAKRVEGCELHMHETCSRGRASGSERSHRPHSESTDTFNPEPAAEPIGRKPLHPVEMRFP